MTDMTDRRVRWAFLGFYVIATSALIALGTILCIDAMLLIKSLSTNNSIDNQLGVGLTEVEAAGACDAICPSSSLNCTEWKDCRFHYPELCRGLVLMCRDHSKLEGPQRVVLDNPALERERDLCLHHSLDDRLFTYLLLVMVLLLLRLVIRSRLAKTIELDGSIMELGEGRPAVLILSTAGNENKILEALKGTIAPEQLAELKKLVMKRLEAEGTGLGEGVETV